MIYKQTSIYKQGGGGGGYSDGGELEEKDFILIQNNTVYEYINTSSETVNFYFENTNEFLNTIIHLTNEVNSVVNVYIKQGDYLFLIGLVGSNNSLNANTNYDININGNSFEIKEIEEPEATPGAVQLFQDGWIPIVKIGSLLWTAKDVFYDFGVPAAMKHEEDGVLYFSPNIVNDINAKLPYGWRVPTYGDYTNLKSTLGTDSGLKAKSTSWGNGTNESGLSLLPNGYYYFNKWVANKGTVNYFVINPSGGATNEKVTDSNTELNYENNSGSPWGYPLRCCCDA